MEKGKINFFHSKSSEIEIVYCKNSHISYPEHNHISVYTIGLVIEGCLELVRKDETSVCYAGHVYIIPPYEPHTIISRNGGYSILSVCIHKNIFSKYGIKGISDTFVELTNYLINSDIISEGQVKLIADTINVLYKSILHKTFTMDNTYTLTKDLLEENPESEMKLNELSHISYASKYHFIRQFKKEFGLTPHQFQIQNRIRKAQHLLLEKHTITEVALFTGFYDQSHFNKCFKKIVGLTPSEYLQAYVLLPDC